MNDNSNLDLSRFEPTEHFLLSAQGRVSWIKWSNYALISKLEIRKIFSKKNRSLHE